MPGYVRAAERRRQLLDAARSVLVRDGLDNLTLRAVAAQAGVHLSTLQYIFRSRAELVDALATQVLTDAGYGQYEVGEGGLERELTRQVEWSATQFLSDEAMLELLRHEYVATIARVDPQDPITLPVGTHLVRADYAARIEDISRQSGETYQRSPEELGRLWGVAQTGLFFEFLAHRDKERFRRDAEVIIAAIVGLAAPSPSSSNQ